MRIILAALVAILLHAGLLAVHPGWIFEQTVHPPRARSVSVTMSYRPPPAPPAPEKEVEPPLPKKPRPPEPMAKPEKPSPRPEPQKPQPAPVAEEKSAPVPEPSAAARVEEESARDEEDVSTTHGDAAANMKVTRKAVPLYKSNPPPQYPRLARRRGYQGEVILSVHVNRQGRVDNLWVFESSGYRLLDQAALEAVRSWAFEPGRKGDQPAAMWVKVPVLFQLK
ncbi:MAG: TonB family protein [Desulfosudaceae bacterium]